MTPTVAIDCRWLTMGGAGRATQLLLRGLAASPPPGHWVLWGPPGIEAWAWPGAELREEAGDPRAMLSQGGWASVPRCDLILFLHLRPLRPVRSITVVYDTIGVRHATTRAGRLARREFLRGATMLSRHVVTASEFSRGCLAKDLGLKEHRTTVIPLPADVVAAHRVLALRDQLGSQDVALYVGRFATHKNLRRLVDAFGHTEFRRRGGRLVLVGGTTDELVALMGRDLTETERAWVDVRRGCTDAEIDELLATSRLLVQPSLEEGFGLPVWEALSCGLPVAVSDGGSLPEITRGWAKPFPALSEDSMARAIDEAGEAGSKGETRRDRAERFLAAAPTVGDYAQKMQDLVLAHV